MHIQYSIDQIKVCLLLCGYTREIKGLKVITASKVTTYRLLFP